MGRFFVANMLKEIHADSSEFTAALVHYHGEMDRAVGINFGHSFMVDLKRLTAEKHAKTAVRLQMAVLLQASIKVGKTAVDRLIKEAETAENKAEILAKVIGIDERLKLAAAMLEELENGQ